MSKRIMPFHVRQVLEMLQPHLAEQDPALRERIRDLFGLVSSSADGTFTRTMFNDTLYRGWKPDSIRSVLSKLRKALADIGNKAGIAGLALYSPTGRGSPEQSMWLESDIEFTIPIPPSTQGVTEVIRQTPGVEASAENLGFQIAVSFASRDQALAENLVEELKVELEARASDMAHRIRFWMFRRMVGEDGIPAGANDHDTIQTVFQESIAGLLCVSPRACASKYIQKEEWPLFYTREGKPLKPACPVLLSTVNENKHKLGVLARHEKNRVWVFDLMGKAWDTCQEKPAEKAAFVEKLVDSLLDKVTAALAPPPPLKNTLSSSQKAFSRQEIREIPFELRGVPNEKAHEGNPDGEAADLRSMTYAQTVKDERKRTPVVPSMLAWACNPDETPFAVLLGEYGMGKTWNSRILARKLEDRIQRPHSPVPFYFDLRKIVAEKESILSGDLPELEFLLNRLSVRNTPSGKTPLAGRDILDAVQKEGALVIFDGLDEVLAHKRDDIWGQQFIDLLFSALPFSCWPKRFNLKSESSNPGKILLTCRTHYFKSVQAQNSQILGVGREEQAAAKPRAWQMLPFSKAQILKYLELHLPNQDPEAVFDLLASVHDLTEISSRPVGLEMVSRQIDRIEAAKREGKTINGADIYAFMVEKWLKRDIGKHRLLEENKRILMQDLALFMWQNGLRELRWQRLAEWFLEWLYPDPVVRQTMHKEVAIQESLLTDLRNATFLVRPNEDAFAFAHTSILEYFLALRLHRSLKRDEAAVWKELNPSPETLAFLLQHQQTSESDIRERVRQRLAAYLARADEDTTARTSWLELYFLLPEEWRIETLDISGLNLKGRTFSGLQLETLRADGARLAESWWKDCRFTRSSWKNAEARQMVFERIQGGEADFSVANLNFARWRQVSLKPCFEGANREGFQMSECATLPVDTSTFPTLRPWRLQWDAHMDEIIACAISDKGEMIVTASGDGTARIWNKEGECLHVLKEHTGGVGACAISAGGEMIVTASDDKTARIWNKEGECLHVLKEHTGGVRACAISAGGEIIVTASDDKTARIWNKEGECLHALKEHTGRVLACAISASGEMIVTASDDRTARIWNKEGECLHVLKEHTGRVRACAISAGGEMIVTASDDKTARIWNKEGECLHVLKEHTGRVRACAISAGGEMIVTASDDKTARIWNKEGKCLHVLKKHTDWVSACAISAGGEMIVTASGDETARIWNKEGECLHVLKEHTGRVRACAISAGGEMIVTASGDKTARIWNGKGECLHVLKEHTSPVRACAISAGGEMIVTESGDETARILNKEGEYLHVLKGHRYGVCACAISAGGEMIVTASVDRTVRIWNKEGECLHVLKEEHTGSVYACAISAGGEMIVTSGDETARIWNKEGECLRVLEGHTGLVFACAISTGGEMIVTASVDRTVRIWNKEGKCLRILKGHTAPVFACAISAGGKMIVTASHDKTARIWNKKGECLRVLKHKGLVFACAISADGERIATASNDRTVRLWNKKGDCLRVLKGHTGCAISADGNTLVTTAPNRIFFWTPQGECKLEIHPATQTRVWLDAETQTLQVDGPEWPELQLHDTSGAHRNLLGLNIAAFGPLAHEQLANAEEWRFAPRSDIQPRGKTPRK